MTGRVMRVWRCRDCGRFCRAFRRSPFVISRPTGTGREGEGHVARQGHRRAHRNRRNGIELLWAGPAPAQTEPPAEAADADEAAIIVTGSRLSRSTFDTPNPVTVMGEESLKQLGVTNVGVGIGQLPSMRASTSPTTQGFGSFNVGANIVNLRGIGVARNLVLVDGRRFAPSTREGSVDLNLVPSNLVSRIEVVTGGASASNYPQVVVIVIPFGASGLAAGNRV